jgi:hypothetical protein
MTIVRNRGSSERDLNLVRIHLMSLLKIARKEACESRSAPTPIIFQVCTRPAQHLEKKEIAAQ